MILGSCALMVQGRFLLFQKFEERELSYLCTQVCRHSWETSSLVVVFVYVALWPRISSGCRQKSEDFFSKLLLGSFVLLGVLDWFL